MRLPIILALAVILLTPANIRDIVHDLSATAGVAVSDWLRPEPVQIAAAESPVAAPTAGATAN